MTFTLLKSLMAPASVEKDVSKRLYFYSTLTAGIVISFIVLPVKLSFATPQLQFTNFLLFTAGLSALILHALSRLGKMYPSTFLVTIGLCFFGVGLLNGGKTGPIPYVFYFNYALLFAIIRNPWRRTVLIAFHVMIAFVIQTADVLFPGLVTPYADELTRNVDTSLVYAAGFITLGILFHQIFQAEKLQTFEYVKSIKKLEKEKETDLLTGCLNKIGAKNILEDLFIYIRTHDSSVTFSLVMADIDHFKQVNDKYGHVVGDHVLHEMGDFLRKSFRTSDFVGRFGGEEFVVVLPMTDLTTAQAISEKIRSGIEKKMFTSKGLTVTMSFGVTEITKVDDIDTLVERADRFLYQSKRNGRNRVTSG